MASQDEHHTNSELGEQLQNHQDDDVSTDERDRIAVVQWLRDNYTINSAGSVSKCEVYAHYLDMCRQKGVTFPMSRTFYGKLVRRAFPGIKSNRKGPRGQAKQHYTHLVRRMAEDDALVGLTGSSDGSGQRRSRSVSMPSSPALSPSSMNSSGCLSFTFQVKPQRPRQRSSSCKSSASSSSSSSSSSSVQSSPMLSPIYTATTQAHSQLSTPTSTSPSPSSSTCSSPRSSVHYSPQPSSPITWPSTPQLQQHTSSQPSSPWPQQYYDDHNSSSNVSRSTSLSPYLDATPMLAAPSVLSREAEVLLYRCAMLQKVRERCREGQSPERPTRDSFLFRAINDPSWNDAWADLGFSEWCLDNLL